MSEEIRESSLFEDVVTAIDKPGSLNRLSMVESIRGFRDDADRERIVRGEKRVGPRDLIGALEKRTGLDLTFGDKDNPTTADTVRNFGVDLLVDIFTSPDSLIAAPAKLLRAGKFLNPAKKAIQKSLINSGAPKRFVVNNVTEQAMERAALGATLGMLSTRPDDEFQDILGAMTFGAAALGAGPQALRGAAKIANAGGEFVLDSVVKNANKEIFEQVEKKFTDIKTFTQATKAVRGLKERTKGLRQLYIDRTENIIVDFETSLLNRGLSSEEIVSKTNQLREVMRRGMSSSIKTRNQLMKDITEAVQSKDIDAINNLPLTFTGSESAKRSLIKMAESGGVVNKDTVLRAATSQTNIIASNKMDGLIQDIDIFEAMSKLRKNNTRMANLFNSKVNSDALKLFNQAEKLAKKGDIKGAKALKEKGDMLLDKTFVPIAFHTLDMKNLTNIKTLEDISGKFSDFKVGMRRSALVAKDFTKGIREEIVEASERYAAMFATSTEREASSLLANIMVSRQKRLDGIDDLPFMSKMFSNKIGHGDKLSLGLRQYDKFINLMKTRHLATGTSWIVTNYTDNVLKAFAFSSPLSALKVATRIPVQAAATIDEKVLGGVGNMLTFGLLKEFNKKNTFLKLVSNFDPMSKSRLRYDDDWMDAMASYGGIDSNKFIDFRRGVQEGNGIMAVREGFQNLGKESDTVSGEVLRNMQIKNNDEFLGKAQDFFWNTIGSIGSATEGTARYIVMKDIAESHFKQYPEFAKVVKEGRLKEIVDRIPRRFQINNKKILKEINEVDEVLKNSAKMTNDIFFDYNHVTDFERLVMKRIFPYWTFFSRNFDQWLRSGFSPDVIARTSKVFKPQQNLGRPLTEEERLGAPQFVLENGARVVDDNGDIKFVWQPNLSTFDFINTGQDLSGSIISKTSPLIKMPLEFIANRKAFGKDIPFKPTQENPKKRIFDTATTNLLFNTFSEDTLKKVFGLSKTDEGKIDVTKPSTAIGLELSDLLVSTPQFLDQAARFRRDKANEEKTDIEAAMNLAPFLRTFKGDSKRLRKNAKKLRENIKTLKGE